MNNEKYLLAKAWDNRIGCAIAIDVLKALKDEKHPNIVFGVGAAQEEIGLRGARTAATKIQPDIGFAVDVGIAGDTPGVTSKEALAKWAMVHKFYYSMHQWYHIKDCVNLSLIQLKKMAFRISLKQFQAAERMQVRSIFLEMVYHHLQFVFQHAIFTRMQAFYIVMIMKIR